MLIKLNSCAIFGLEIIPVEVEVFLAGGKPLFDIVGLPDAAINEAKIRVRSALSNSGIGYPYSRRVIANLAPADLQKEGPSYDLAFGVGIALSNAKFKCDLSDAVFVGELSLEGQLRPIKGIMAIADYAKKNSWKRVFFPEANLCEARMISGIELYPVKKLPQLMRHIYGEQLIEPVVTDKTEIPKLESNWLIDLAHVKGQFQARRALEIAAAGQHNLIMNGPPGSGKTLLAKSLPSILPSMNEDEMLEVTKIYSIAGLLPPGNALIKNRPIRSPHHTSSMISLIGGGRIPKPGEITLAHRGVLFLDEFPEFSRQSLETLRQPIEDGIVSISRVEATLTYPARFMLVASQNPCPCGYLGDTERECICTPLSILRYQQKISGPILDRIDLHVTAGRVPYDDLRSNSLSESSEVVQARVEAARVIQDKRFNDPAINFNSQMNSKDVTRWCALDSSGELLLKKAAEQMKLSARSYHRILKVARTIADLGFSENILTEHLAEALQYRFK